MKTWKSILKEELKICREKGYTVGIIFDTVQQTMPNYKINDLEHTGAYFHPKRNRETGELTGEIHIDDSPKDVNLQITMIFHEFGHAHFYFKHPNETSNSQISEKISEVAAYTYSLKKLLELFNSNQKDPLKETITRIKNKYDDEAFPPNWREAIGEVMKTELWKTCKDLINN